MINPSNSDSIDRDYLENETKPYQENFDYLYRGDYTDSDIDRNSYLERMSNGHSDSLEGRRQQGSYLGSYHRIRWVLSPLNINNDKRTVCSIQTLE